MQEEHNDRFRMYGLVPYNISPIQQAIQYGHALQEFNNIMIDNGPMIGSDLPKNFREWRLECKTFIILNGGTTGTQLVGEGYHGSLNNHADTLNAMGVQIATFYEPDLGNQLTAVVFLVPEQVYNRKLYPDFHNWEPLVEYCKDKRGLLMAIKYNDYEPTLELTELALKWETEVMGGETNRKLREFVQQFRLA